MTRPKQPLSRRAFSGVSRLDVEIVTDQVSLSPYRVRTEIVPSAITAGLIRAGRAGPVKYRE
jgi:hypothetical protein